MSRIIVLQPVVANQIAAGEVVERPGSVVKELFENSVDAGASAITVEIQNGGIDYIRVTDNGGGIPEEDCLVAFTRHATSKIRVADDLTHIETLGFRGEALSSIASVTRMHLKTRCVGAQTGTEVVIEGGEVKRSGPVACPEGTTIEVSDLFYNVPARRKFLKAPRTEASYVGEYLSRMILARPDISVKLIVNGKTQYHSPGDNNLQNAIYCVYGGEVLPQLRPISFDDGYVMLSGFVGTANLARPNRSHQSFLLNGRYIRSALLSSALQQAYDTRLMGGRFPFAVVAIRISSFEVDVNVHPNKLEVRFINEGRIQDAMRSATAKALLGDAVPSVKWSPTGLEPKISPREVQFPARISPEGRVRTVPDLTKPPAAAPPLREAAHAGMTPDWTGPVKPERAEQDTDKPERRHKPNSPPVLDKPPVIAIPSGAAKQKLHEEEQAKFGIEPYAIAGQVFDTYWIVQQGERVFFIDQHAAHERRLYERLMGASGETASQQLLLPETITLTYPEQDTFDRQGSLLSEIGFVIEPFGPLCIRVTAVPSILESRNVASLIHEALDLIARQGRAATKELRKDAIVQLACKHAVKAGDALSAEEIEMLLREFAKEGAPMTCPHGRPVMVQMTKRELEKLFKRVL